MYPIDDPQILSLDTAIATLAAALKCDVTVAIPILEKRLVCEDFLRASSVRIFIFAHRQNLKEEVWIVLQWIVRTKVVEIKPSEEMKSIDGYTYAQIVELWQRRCLEARKIVDNYPAFPCVYSGHSCSTWWSTYKSRVQVELSERPSTALICQPSFIFQTYTAQYGYQWSLEHVNGLIAKLDSELPDKFEI